MTLASMMSEDVSDVFLKTEDFAETLRRHVEGVKKPYTVTALVTWEDAAVTAGDGKREARIRGSLSLAADPSLSMSDRWELNGVTYQATAVSPPQYGMQTVLIEHRKSDLRSSSMGII